MKFNINNISLSLIIFTFLGTAHLYCDATFPFTIKSIDFHNGELLIMKDRFSNSLSSYLVKPNWAGESDVIYTWKGIERKNAKGYSVGSSYIISSFILKSSILSILIDKRKLYLVQFDSTIKALKTREIEYRNELKKEIKVEWLGITQEEAVLLTLDDFLFEYNIHSDSNILKPTAADVMSSTILRNFDLNGSAYICAFLARRESSMILYTVDKNWNIRISARLPLSEKSKIYQTGKSLVVFSSSFENKQSLVQMVEPGKGVISARWLDTQIDLISIYPFESQYRLALLQSISGKHNVEIYNIDNLLNLVLIKRIEISASYFEPIKLSYSKTMLSVIFRNGVVLLDGNGDILASDHISIGESFISKPKVEIINDFIVLSNSNASMVLKRASNSFWYVNRFIDRTGQILIPLVLIIVIIIIIQIYRHQKRLFKEIIELPSSGLIIIVDRIGRVIKLNESAKKFLLLPGNVQLRKNFTYYFNSENSQPLKNMVEESLGYKDIIKRKINIIEDTGLKEWLCTAVPIRNIAGTFRGLVFTGIDITEQLERNRLSNWAQLAHDLQTNLSTIRLNAEQFIAIEGEDNYIRKKKIIHQVNLIIQRVRDLVTVGRAYSIERAIIGSMQICYDVRNEFDEQIFANIDFVIEGDNFPVSCDKDKLVRALRNAVENSIRAIQGKKGRIVIKCLKDQRYAYFSVIDNGKGMDENLKKEILKPYFTTSKAKGGTGIGTMIMQQVAELHGGEISINSELGTGTEIVFSFPNIINEKRTRNISKLSVSIN